MNKEKIVVIDLSVLHTSPAGSCVLSEIVGLSNSYEVHLFSTEVDESIEDLVVFHQIKVFSFPLFFRYMLFFTSVKTKVRKFLKKHKDVSIVQTTQGQYVNCTISYPHFCHKAYLRKYWKDSTVKGTQRFARKINHLINRNMEAKAFKNASHIVVPSQGLFNELTEFYPEHKHKVQVIANPIDIKKFEKPKDFDKSAHRKQLGIEKEDFVISFVALGDFARKGLPELMQSLKDPRIEHVRCKILVVGGKPDEIKKYEEQAESLGMRHKILFVGFQKDIRNFLWVSDIFSLPSIYEIFPLVCVQAAAAGIPILVSKLHGVEEYLVHTENGWLVERNPKAIATVLEEVHLQKYDVVAMGKKAIRSVEKYDHEAFRKKWNTLYAAISK